MEGKKRIRVRKPRCDVFAVIPGCIVCVLDNNNYELDNNL